MLSMIRTRSGVQDIRVGRLGAKAQNKGVRLQQGLADDDAQGCRSVRYDADAVLEVERIALLNYRHRGGWLILIARVLQLLSRMVVSMMTLCSIRTWVARLR